MTAAHTPKPWELDPAEESHVVSEDYHVIKAGCGFLSEAKAEREPGFRIAGHMTIEDARLIAAAPELLVALQQAQIAIAQVGVQDHLIDYAFHRKAVKEMAAAIAKATGSPA